MKIANVLARTVDYRLRPRYAESDQMGVVYYAHYLVWFECARTEWLRQSGKTYAQLEAEGVFLPVRRCQIDYLAPARYDRLTCIRARVTKLTPVRVEFAYEVFDEEDAEEPRKLAEGMTVHAFVDASGKIVRRGLAALGVKGEA